MKAIVKAENQRDYLTWYETQILKISSVSTSQSSRWLRRIFAIFCDKFENGTPIDFSNIQGYFERPIVSLTVLISEYLQFFVW